MKGRKLRILDHVVYDLKRFDDMPYTMADLNEAFCTSFRRDYKDTSSHPKTGMKEMLLIQAEKALLLNSKKSFAKENTSCTTFCALIFWETER